MQEKFESAGEDMIYFDSCASTPPYEEVVDVVAEVMKSYYANPSSLHNPGQQAERLLTKAREQIGGILGMSPLGIVFTSGGTESNALAIRGAAERFRSRGMHIVVSPYEHASVHENARLLESMGYSVTRLPGYPDGRVRIEDVRDALRDDTILVSVMHVNNEIGSIQPIQEIGALLRGYPKILFHVDAVQSIGKMPLEADRWGIDLVSGSAHKFRGPRGTGFLYVREGVELTPLLPGGGQEGGLRSGTQNVPGVVGMAKALRLYAERHRQALVAMGELRRILTTRLGELPGVEVTSSGDTEHFATHIVHFSVPGVKSEVMLHSLEREGVVVSAQSACSSGEERPSRILLAAGRSEASARSGIRVCLTAEHEGRDIERLIQAVERTLKQLGGIR